MITQIQKTQSLSPQHVPAAPGTARSLWRADGLDIMFSALAARQMAAMKATALQEALQAAVVVPEITMTPGQ
ncbi:hypothetical protein [Kordiimonas pumila]|uniref:Uncharacterized protein n=1 Tax=Kordiimonas pumila TaxID=2161677 RepID=A0ABV7D380_9PROT|nr:hypothetical protein [Kordiimonas pumila]